MHNAWAGRFANAVGPLGLAAVILALAPQAQAASAHTVLAVSAIVANSCTITVTQRGNGNTVSSECAYHQPYTITADADPASPASVEIGHVGTLPTIAIVY